ncbi:MAG: aromatic amino acid lyase [Acidobacteriota bacterium]
MADLLDALHASSAPADGAPADGAPAEADSGPVRLDGESLTLDQLVRLARDPRTPVECCDRALRRMRTSADLIAAIATRYRDGLVDLQRRGELELEGDDLEVEGIDLGSPGDASGLSASDDDFEFDDMDTQELDEALETVDQEDEAPDDKGAAGSSSSPMGRFPVQDYGVTTGFGEFKSIPVAPHQLEQLQRNILLSHSAGAGDTSHSDDPANYYPAEVVRGALATRVNAFLRGHSGVREVMVKAVLTMLRRGIVPLVPTRGSVGASGDLCPLSHLFAVLLGEGRYLVLRTPEEVAAPLVPTAAKSAARLAEDLGMEPPAPSFKEGLALTNGTNFSTTLLALAVHDAERMANVADVAAALSLEAACGCARALDPRIHALRAHPGQQRSAANLRQLLSGSRLLDSAGSVQDVYSLRCAPQVHGASRDAIAHARRVVDAELNAVTDNPLFFPGEDGALHDEEPWDLAFRDNWPETYDGRLRASYSAGNFHGQPVALAADFLAIALAELASVSERRGQLLLDAHHNRNLPANLVPHRGVNSGLMIAQYLAAGIVSENKVLTHPACVDTIPTSSNTEDHVSMSATAARKLRTVAGNLQSVLAVELLISAQALDWRAAMGYRAVPDGTLGTDAAPPGDWKAAEEEAKRFAEVTADPQATAQQLGQGTARAFLAIRDVVAPLVEDRVLAGDIAGLRRLVAASSQA